MKISWLLRLVWLWPPFLGAGISVKAFNKDYTQILVQMKHRFWNNNYVGTHFGGSLYSMTDPFYMLILIHHLGKNFEVWDKSASIKYRKPGRGRVFAQFKLDKKQIQAIKEKVYEQGVYEHAFPVQIVNQSKEVVAEVEKLIHIKLKQQSTSSSKRKKYYNHSEKTFK